MKNKNIVIGVLAILVILFFGLYISKPTQLINLPLGATAGTYHTNAEEFVNTVAFSGAITNSATLTQSGAATLSGTNILSGATRIYSPVVTGAIAVLSGSTTTTITASQACAGTMVYASSSITEASTLNLPTAEAMFAASNCLSTDGDAVTMWARNMTASTTVITAGSASTTIAIDNGGTVTLGALGTARIVFKRLSSSLMYAFVSVFKP